MKHAGPTRREIGVRTAFNLIGPMTNPPAPAPGRRVGDPSRRRRWPSSADARLGTRPGRPRLRRRRATARRSGVLYDVTPAGVVKRRCARTWSDPGAAVGPGGRRPEENAALVEAVLGGEPGRARRRPAQRRGGIGGAGRAAGLGDGITLAAQTIDTGRARRNWPHSGRQTARDAAKLEVTPA